MDIFLYRLIFQIGSSSWSYIRCHNTVSRIHTLSYTTNLCMFLVLEAVHSKQNVIPYVLASHTPPLICRLHTIIIVTGLVFLGLIIKLMCMIDCSCIGVSCRVVMGTRGNWRVTGWCIGHTHTYTREAPCGVMVCECVLCLLDYHSLKWWLAETAATNVVSYDVHNHMHWYCTQSKLLCVCMNACVCVCTSVYVCM